jgi:CheY-specific phosphatase CheX
MPENRNHSRVAVQIEVSIHCDNGSVYRGIIKDLSISGVNIKISKVYDMGTCSNGSLKMKLGPKDNPFVVEIHGELVRIEQDTIIYRLVGSDPTNFQLLKKAILNHTSDPENVLDEIKYNPDISLNSLYLPAMRDAIGHFLQHAVESIFKIYLNTEVSIVAEKELPPLTDIVVSGVSSFNGAIYGSTVLVTDLSFAQKLVAELLEQDHEDIDKELIVDGFGEMANMISGGIQTDLSEEYENISLIPPMVFIGAQCMYGSDQLFSVRKNFHCHIGYFSVDCLFSIV